MQHSTIFETGFRIKALLKDDPRVCSILQKSLELFYFISLKRRGAIWNVKNKI